jgi:hypothetical protein
LVDGLDPFGAGGALGDRERPGIASTWPNRPFGSAATPLKMTVYFSAAKNAKPSGTCTDQAWAAT